MKPVLTFWVALLLAPVVAAAGLEVVNGDFSDLDGMTPGPNGWYSGLPKGWSGSESAYAVHNDKVATRSTCNPSVLGFFRQCVGVLDRPSDVTLTFDVSEPWQSESMLNATILDGHFVELARGEFAPGLRHTLVARQVPAGTSIVIAFGAAKHTPGLDNVSVSVTKLDASAVGAARPPVDSVSPVTVACYYFGNYHVGDPRNARQKGPDWSEWELVKAARPRFPGHHQPNVPLWGYTDESKPDVMAQKIDAAADHGIDAFIFDWYYYNDGPFLDRPIDRGFLKAKNNHRLKFALMWANHDWIDIHPYRRGAERTLLYPGAVTPETFEKVCDHVIGAYFLHPSYWRIDGKPYFSFYDLTKLLDSFGSVEGARAALDAFRAKAVAAGLPGLHLNAVVWGQPILPGEQKPADAAQLVKDLGFDSVTSYVWIHHVHLPTLQTDYNEVRDNYFRYWSEAERKHDVPYFPNVTMGWDASPRAHQDDAFGNFGYPFMNTISGNTPERFREALAMTKRRLLAKSGGPRIVNINCWNEWTEGSYLEPDTVHGMKYLEAVRDVFDADHPAENTNRRTTVERKPRPLVGVIRWDGYNGSPKWTQQQEFGFLKPKRWHELAPWFVRRTGDPDCPLTFNPLYDKDVIQEVTDQEIRYAAEAGIDYWAFCHYAAFKGGGWQLRDNLEAYLASPLKSRINFCLIALGVHIGKGINGVRNPSPDDVKADWTRYVDEYIALMREPTYQRVLGDRPLLYLMGPDTLSASLGDPPSGKGVTVNHLRQAVALLRERAVKAGVGDPYIVGMNSGGIWAAVYIDKAGLDAVSAYRGAFGSTEEGTPYADLWPNIRKGFIENPCGMGDNPRRQLVVPLMSGASHLPRHEVRPRSFGPQHYLEPLPGEFRDHVLAGMDWVANHSENCAANSVLIYAWNEHSEGGRICPTMGQEPEYVPNTRLLDELGQAIEHWNHAASAKSGALPKYRDGRPEATLRMNAKDHGIVLRYGDGPKQCDMLGARDVWVFEESGIYSMHYDAAGPEG